ncbi:hypothetical protein SAMD00019534_095230 [Acytostelium subglobosum LB1]|uniref:hypothetical protein n=1 Tax=Acytostelium subglobosum LB1 TaxID=1410327 RepID=UPI0006448DC1|nr:hypothetical protein SAMD00019534_095230 [Acytostelium subglobosum LB1]GAM26348.1 hypothetical protein SAMD00019534_095230 [Acytostelium subglobosum LB1]|eukprot:XP_012750902.1 hypothetical protein SAMD00019534_095230 [Acytostelium subglobosum LB1]
MGSKISCIRSHYDDDYISKIVVSHPIRTDVWDVQPLEEEAENQSNIITPPEVSCSTRHTTTSPNDLLKLINSVSFELDSIELNDDDSISFMSLELLQHIASYLRVEDIITVQSVSRFWYMVGGDNQLWKMIFKRDMRHWKNDKQPKELVSRYDRIMDVKWKKIYCDIYRQRVCTRCNVTYQQYSNTRALCTMHTDIREIVETNRGVPSGVYWNCCLAKPKDAPGCSQSAHQDEPTNHKYYY